MEAVKNLVLLEVTGLLQESGVAKDALYVTSQLCKLFSRCMNFFHQLVKQ